MAPPSPDAIAAFMRVTGESDSLARRKLEEHGGNLDEALNAYFAEAERYTAGSVSVVSPQHGYANSSSSQVQVGDRGILPMLSAARSFKPSLLLDPNYRWNLYNQIGSWAHTGRLPPSTGQFSSGYHTQQRQDNFEPWRIEGVHGPASSHFPQPPGNASSRSQSQQQLIDSSEEEMIRLAIEASRQEHIAGSKVQQVEDDEDEELARVMALSLQTAEQEKQMQDGTMGTHRELAGVGDSRKRTEECDSGKGKNMERLLAAKEASLPPEPPVDDENAVSLVIHMPDGKRQGRCFLKSHKLQSFFDFIDVGRAVEPGSYRVVRQYPRRAYGIDDGASSLEELCLTNKHEVLFLELI